MPFLPQIPDRFVPLLPFFCQVLPPGVRGVPSPRDVHVSEVLLRMMKTHLLSIPQPREPTNPRADRSAFEDYQRLVGKMSLQNVWVPPGGAHTLQAVYALALRAMRAPRAVCAICGHSVGGAHPPRATHSSACGRCARAPGGAALIKENRCEVSELRITDVRFQNCKLQM